MALTQRDELAHTLFTSDATHDTNPDTAPAGAYVAIVGDPSDGDVPTFDTALGYFVPGAGGGGSTAPTLDSYTAALRMDGDARVREDGISTTGTTTTTTDPFPAALQADANARIREAAITALDEQQVALLAQYYGA